VELALEGGEWQHVTTLGEPALAELAEAVRASGVLELPDRTPAPPNLKGGDPAERWSGDVHAFIDAWAVANPAAAGSPFLLFLASSQLYPWYIGMVLPLAVLGYQTWISRAVVLASAAHLLGFTGLKRVGYFLICTLLPFAAAFFGAVRLKLLRTAPHPPAAPLRRSTANG
jgi:hypothetical protein